MQLQADRADWNDAVIMVAACLLDAIFHYQYSGKLERYPRGDGATS